MMRTPAYGYIVSELYGGQVEEKLRYFKSLLFEMTAGSCNVLSKLNAQFVVRKSGEIEGPTLREDSGRGAIER